MLAARPGARSTGASLGPESSEPRDRARLGPRGSGGGHRPGAYLYPYSRGCPGGGAGGGARLCSLRFPFTPDAR